MQLNKIKRKIIENFGLWCGVYQMCNKNICYPSTKVSNTLGDYVNCLSLKKNLSFFLIYTCRRIHSICILFEKLCRNSNTVYIETSLAM